MPSTLKTLNPLYTFFSLKTLNPCTHFHMSQLEDPELSNTRSHTSHLEDLDCHFVNAPQHSPVHSSEAPCPQQLLPAVGVPTQLQLSGLQHKGCAQSAEHT